MGVEPNAKLFDWKEPDQGKKAGFGKWKNPQSPYDLFIEAQGLEVHRDIGVHKVQDLPLKPWKRLGGKGHRDPASRHRRHVRPLRRRSAGRRRA
jgi:hypothetical protein